MTALHTLNNTVAKGLNSMAPPARTITVALDRSKAVDTINKIPGTIIKFIANYIEGRNVYTTYRKHTSSQKETFMATYKADRTPALEYASPIWSCILDQH